jgi:hypothetical protein
VSKTLTLFTLNALMIVSPPFAVGALITVAISDGNLGRTFAIFDVSWKKNYLTE